MSKQPIRPASPVLAWLPAVACLVIGLGVPLLVGLRQNCALQLCLSAVLTVVGGLVWMVLGYAPARWCQLSAPPAFFMSLGQQVARFGLLILALLTVAQLHVWWHAGREQLPCDGITYAGATQLLFTLWFLAAVACGGMLVGVLVEAERHDVVSVV